MHNYLNIYCTHNAIVRVWVNVILKMSNNSFLNSSFNFCGNRTKFEYDCDKINS